jgi:hypothetical protein
MTINANVSLSFLLIFRGTMHGWKNPGNVHCRFMTVIIPSAPVKMDTGSVLGMTKIPGLTD